jgi:hypothetical protein
MRAMHRYVVPVDGAAHLFGLTSNPVAVANAGIEAVEFWAEHTEEAPVVKRLFQVFGTGHPLPGGARYFGTAPRISGLVWHLYEVTL